MSRTRIVAAAPFAAAALLLAPAPAWAATGTLSAEATADQETQGGREGASASGMFRVDTDAGEFCYDVSATDLDDAAAMHIHVGGAGEDGDIVIELDAAQIGAGETCTDTDAGVLEDILADPEGYYLNVHTPDFPAGAVRGQLMAEEAPGGVDAGGGAASGTPVLPILLLLGGGVVVAAGTWRVVRR